MNQAIKLFTRRKCAAITAFLLLTPLLALARVIPPAGYALDFNGANNYVSLSPTSPPATNYTISAWVYLRTGGIEFGTRMAVLSSTVCGGSIELLIHSQTVNPGDPQYLELGRCGSFNGFLSTIPVPLNTWTHVAATLSSNNMVSYYINGAPAGSYTDTNPSDDYSIGTAVNLGDNSGQRQFDGILDEVEIWSRALSQDEIATNWNRSLTGAEAGLFAYYRCDDGSGGALADSSTAGGGGAGTLVNSPAWDLSGVPLFESPDIPYLGAHQDLGSGWRTSAVNKPLDIDGDNILGSDGYFVVNRPPVIPSYVSQMTNLTGFSPGDSLYASMDDPTNLPSLFETGTWNPFPGRGASADLLRFTLGASAVGRRIRVSLLVDNLDYAVFNAASVELVRTNGAGGDSGPVATTSVPFNDGSPDWIFFDIIAPAPGDTFVIRAVGGQNAAATLAGVAFDSVPILVTSVNDDSSPGTLRAVVASAPAGATITFSTNLEGYVIRLTNGQITLGKNLTLDGSALTNVGVQIGADLLSRLFYVQTNAVVVMNTIQLTYGSIVGSNGVNGAPGVMGGGIYNAGTLTLNQIELDVCLAQGGNGGLGGRANMAGIPGAGGQGGNGLGGGIYNAGTLTVNKSTFFADLANGGGGTNGGDAGGGPAGGAGGTGGSGLGGAIYNAGTLTINQSTLVADGVTGGNGGSQGSGAGAKSLGGKGGNGEGAGIYNTATLAFNQATLALCRTSYGASGGTGGANGLDVGGGIYGASTFSIFNSIVDGNIATTGSNLFGIYTKLGKNLTNVDLNTLLNQQLANYGGPTATLLPLAGSLAIDTGGDMATNAPWFFTTDQRGAPRSSGKHIDVGAVELGFGQPTITSLTATVTGTNSATGELTVQLAATVSPGSELFTTLNFQYGLTSAYAATSAPVVLAPFYFPYESSFVSVTVPSDIGFGAGFTFHWNVVATNSSAVTVSPDQTFHLSPPGLLGDLDGDGVVSQSELNTVYSNYMRTAPDPPILDPEGLGGANISFALSNAISGSYTVQYSTDLVNWHTLGPAMMRYDFTDTNAPNSPHRFYRLTYP